MIHCKIVQDVKLFVPFEIICTYALLQPSICMIILLEMGLDPNLTHKLAQELMFLLTLTNDSSP
jgi:hypothetical protein